MVAAAAPASLASKRATASIPIVSVYAADPVGLRACYTPRPAGCQRHGNLFALVGLCRQALQLLREVAPRTSRVGVLGHTANPTYAIYRQELERAGRAMGLPLEFVGIKDPAEIETALSTMVRRGADAFFVMNQPLTFDQRANIVNFVARLRLPAMYGSREAVELGGLISYGAGVEETFRRAAFFVDKVIRGAKAVELPFEQPTKFNSAAQPRTHGIRGGASVGSV